MAILGGSPLGLIGVASRPVRATVCLHSMQIIAVI
jgi:hypothetical protein